MATNTKQAIKELAPGTIFTAGGDTYLLIENDWGQALIQMSPGGVSDPMPLEFMEDGLQVQVEVTHHI